MCCGSSGADSGVINVLALILPKLIQRTQWNTSSNWFSFQNAALYDSMSEKIWHFNTTKELSSEEVENQIKEILEM
jgi:hypothetical protein